MSAAAPAGDLSALCLEAVPAGALAIGRVIDAYGLRGGLKIVSYAEQPETFGRLKHVWAHKAPRAWRLAVLSAKSHNELALVSVGGVADRDQALALKGAEIFIERSQLPDPEPGEWYWADLIGCVVENAQGVQFGMVASLLETGAHDVLKVVEATAPSAVASTIPQKNSKSKVGKPRERLIPFVEQFLVKVDMPNRRIIVDWHPDD